MKVWLIAGCSAGKNTCPQRRGNAKTPCSLKRKRGNNEIIKVTQAPPGLLSLLPLLPSFYLSSLPLPRFSNWSKINRQINEWIHGCGRIDLLSAVLPRNAAQRSAPRKALLLFLGSIFFGSSPPSAGAPPLYLPLEPLSPVRVFSVVLHACSCVPLSLFVGAGPTLRNLNALWWGEALRTDGWYAAPLLFFQPPSPLFSSTPLIPPLTS